MGGPPVESLGNPWVLSFMFSMPDKYTRWNDLFPKTLSSQAPESVELKTSLGTVLLYNGSTLNCRRYLSKNECLLVFLVTHTTVILLHSRNRKTLLSCSSDCNTDSSVQKERKGKKMTQGCDLLVFSTHNWMNYNNKNYY